MIQTTLSGTAREIHRFLADGLHLLAVGNTNTAQGDGAWPIEAAPPGVPFNLARLDNLCGFVPVRRIVPVVQHPDGDVLLADGTRWIDLPRASEEYLIGAACDAVLIEADIHHNFLPDDVLKYRSVALYVGCHTQDTIHDNTYFIASHSVRGHLDTAWYFPPIEKDINRIHRVQLIRRFQGVENKTLLQDFSVSLGLVSSTTVTLHLSSTAPQVYAIALESPSTTPAPENIEAGLGQISGYASGVFVNTLEFRGLDSFVEYDFYTVFKDIYGFYSAVQKVSAKTLISSTLSLDISKAKTQLFPGMGM